jgi:hypothetical protein
MVRSTPSPPISALSSATYAISTFTIDFGGMLPRCVSKISGECSSRRAATFRLATASLNSAFATYNNISFARFYLASSRVSYSEDIYEHLLF